MSGTCSGCKHWDHSPDPFRRAITIDGARYTYDADPDAAPDEASAYAQQLRLNKRFGICTAIHEGWDIPAELAESTKATAWDGSSYKAEVNTRDDFGCVLFDASSAGLGYETADMPHQDASKNEADLR